MIIFLLLVIIYLLLVIMFMLTEPQEERKSTAIGLGVGGLVGSAIWMATEYGLPFAVVVVHWVRGLHFLGFMGLCGVGIAALLVPGIVFDRRNNKRIRAGDKHAIAERKKELMTRWKYTEERADAAIERIRAEGAGGKERQAR